MIIIKFFLDKEFTNNKQFHIEILYKMDPQEEKEIIEEIMEDRHLPYSIELRDVEGDKYTVLNNFGSTMVYIKKDNSYFLEEEL
jgi:hypothetical protein